MKNSFKLAGLAAGVSVAALSAATVASAQPLANPLMVPSLRGQAAEVVEPEGNFLRPRVGLQAGVTDNVNRSSTDKQSDTFARASVGLEGQYDSPRAQVNLTGDLTYDVYAKNQKYDTLSFSGAAGATYIVVPEVLAFDAAGMNTQGSSSTFGATDFYRNSSPADYQISSYYVGPRLAISPAFADISAAARFGRTFFDGSDVVPLQPLDEKTSFYQVIGAADTKDRLGRVRLVTSAQYQQDDEEFASTSGSVSGFLQATDRFTGILRIGYDDTKINDTLSVEEPFWAVGGQFVFADESFIRLEGGQRYDRPYWAGQAQYRASRRITLLAGYTNVLETGAIAVNSVLVDYVGDLSEPLPLPSLQGGFRLNTNYFDQAAINRTGNVRAMIDLDRQTLAFELTSSEQKFLTVAGRFRTFAQTVNYAYQARPDLRFSLQFTHATGSYAGSILTGTADRDGRYYQTTAQAEYRLNSRTKLTAAYQNRRSKPDGQSNIDSFDENVGTIALIRTF